MNPFSWQSAAIILNRGSGAVTRIGADVLSEGLSSIFAAAGKTAVVHVVDGAEIAQTLQRAAEGPEDVVIVGGGDGTVATAATLLAGQVKPLGILPLGTFNLAARDVGMPVDWELAALALASAHVDEMDLLQVGDKLYCCMLVLGFYPALAMKSPEYHGHWLVKTCKVTLAALRSMATYPPLDLTLRDRSGAELRHRTRIALIANNDYEDLFGVIPKRSSLDGGYFTLYVSTHRTRWGMMRSLLKWLVGRWKQDRELLMFQASEVQIHIRGRKRAPVMTDGEVAPIAVPFTVKVRPKALRVLRPAPPEEEPAAEPG